MTMEMTVVAMIKRIGIEMIMIIIMTMTSYTHPDPIKRGVSVLGADSIEGKVFAGQKNIERNNEGFYVKDIFSECQVVTYKIGIGN
jgi:hypothetical protein